VSAGGYGLPPSTGVHDDVSASAVYFQDGDTRAVLISFDLLAMERDLIARLKEAIRAVLPIPAGNIFFTCTHTHEGPEVRERKFRDHWGRTSALPTWMGTCASDGARRPVSQAAAAAAQEFDLVVNRATSTKTSIGASFCPTRPFSASPATSICST